MAEISENTRVYYQRVGAMTSRYNLPVGSTDKEVLEYEREVRSKRANLGPSASWFEIFCVELRDYKTEPEVPSYCDCKDVRDWQNSPQAAIVIAQQAANIFKPKPKP